MAQSQQGNTEINKPIHTLWKDQLENLARIYSVDEGRTVTFLDLMRRGIKEKYQLTDGNDDGQE